MKKLKLFFALMVVAAFATAQTVSPDGRNLPAGHVQTQWVYGADEIGDFTITDSDGVSHNLYESLDAGKTVFIDLFFST